MIAIHNFGEIKGKGLVSTCNIPKGHVLFCEKPLVSIQFSWNKKYKYFCCEYCMKPLEDVEENLRRLTNNNSITVPSKDLCKILNTKSDFVCCNGCNETYCSNNCMEQAYASYHKLLCKSSGLISQEFLTNFETMWNSLHYPPETSNLMIIIKIIAMLSLSENKMELMNKFASFCHSTSDETNHLVLKLFNENFLTNLQDLFNMYKEHMFNPNLDKNIYTFDGFLRIIGIICRNSQGVATNSFSLWQKAVEEKFGDSPEFEKFVDEMYKLIDDHVGNEFIDNEGIGLFEKQSLINHSCAPNCEVKLNSLNNEISIVSLCDIKENEEITISYLDECMINRSRYSRQKYLKDYYLFLCRCGKCESEFNDPNETSEEEEEMSE